MPDVPPRACAGLRLGAAATVRPALLATGGVLLQEFEHPLSSADAHLVYRFAVPNRSGAGAAPCVGKGDHDISLNARGQLVGDDRCVIATTGSGAPRAADLNYLVVEAYGEQPRQRPLQHARFDH